MGVPAPVSFQQRRPRGGAELDRRSQWARDRFGLITTWIDGNGQRVYFDDLTYICGP